MRGFGQIQWWLFFPNILHFSWDYGQMHWWLFFPYDTTLNLRLWTYAMMIILFPKILYMIWDYGHMQWWLFFPNILHFEMRRGMCNDFCLFFSPEAWGMSNDVFCFPLLNEAWGLCNYLCYLYFSHEAWSICNDDYFLMLHYIWVGYGTEIRIWLRKLSLFLWNEILRNHAFYFLELIFHEMKNLENS